MPLEDLSEPGAGQPVSEEQSNARFPVSPVQQRLWLLDQLDPGNPAYSLPMIAFRLRGRPRLRTFEECFTEIERRHEALRTVFPEHEGGPCQRVRPAARKTLPVVDLSAVPRERREAFGLALAQAEARRRFDLARGPVWRTLVLRCAPDDHFLLLTLHHIVSDAWSVGILFRELAALYEALSRGLASPLRELQIQYKEYAARQHRMLEGPMLEVDLAFWQERLAGAPSTVRLPADRPRPTERTFRARREIFDLPADLPTAVAALAERHNVTLYIGLLAAVSVLLQRYTGQADVVLGCPVAGRTNLAAEPLIGFLVNTVVMRNRVGPAATVRELMHAVRESVLDVYDHQDVPFDRVVKRLQPKRDLSYDPIFQIMFSLQNARIPVLGLGDLGVEPLRIHNGTSQFETIFFAGADPRGLLTTLQIEYNTDLFDVTTIQRAGGHLMRLLAHFAADPDARIGELSMLTTVQRQQLVTEWADRIVVPVGACLHDLFELQRRRRPEQVALIHDLETLSYDELGRRSDQLARRLRRRGVGAETVVALCLERSAALVVAILGVLKAGGAYLPVDPALPVARRAFLLSDSGAGILIVKRREGVEWAGGVAATTVVDLDEVGDDEVGDDEVSEASERAGASGRLSPVRPENLAYVIYTSGSTGQPKGCLVGHGEVVRLLRGTEDRFAFGPDDVWTLFHSFAFDFSVWELWGALAYGGTLVLVSEDVRRSPEAFHQLLTSEGVTVLNQTPSAFQQLSAADQEADEPLALRLCIFGGEALDFASLRPWFRRRGEAVRMVNMYGITETTVHVTYRPVNARDAEAGGSRIGRPLPDLELHLLDRTLRPTPQGVAGEICVAGAGLARGYLARPALSAERFVPHPFSRRPGDRLYRSGDLARHGADGDVAYLGRRDHQVKVRGFRIEQGEIEAALGEHPGVARAAVAAWEAGTAGMRLAAYFVAAGAASAPAADELRASLGRRLPEYMLPSSFTQLDELPLTANGKLDRRALPAPHRGREGDRVAPRTPTERRVAELWAAILDLPGEGVVGAHDDFFELGGHSLLATRLVAALRKELGAEVSVRVIFEKPTVADIAAAAEAAMRAGSEGRGPALVAAQRRRRAARR